LHGRESLTKPCKDFFLQTENTTAAGDNTLQPLNDVIREEIPGSKNPSTPWRWITRGIAGLNGERIRLKVWYVGRAPHTTKTAVRQWLEAVTEARLARMARTQQRADDVTDAELEAVGLTGTRR
jgi:hypothetical protein